MFEQWIRRLTLATFGAVVSLALLSFSGDQAGAAGLLSPADGSKPALQIKNHSVTVVIEDGYALTTVEQVFHNPHGEEFEAVYSFPVPEKAAVAEFTYWINGKPISGEVLSKKQARQVYEEEKAAGHEAGLTEQDGYKTFDISVWPVEPGKDTRIRLTYIQPAHVDTGVGRYVYPLEEGGVDEEKLSFWTANEKVTGRFSFDLLLRPAYAVAAVRLPSHPATVITESASGEWRIHMDNGASAPVEEETATPAPPGKSFRLDTDVVVYWRHQPGLPGSIDLVPYKEASNSRGAFMLVLTPGDDLKPITEGRDWVFVLHTSGSMSAKYHTLVEGVAKGLSKFRPEDRFRFIVFNSQAAEVGAGFVNATPENIKQAVAALRSITPGNSTNLYAGLEKGLEGLDSDRSSGIVLVTDGEANVGVTEKRSFLKLIKKQDVRLYTMVMGNSANRPLLEAISKESGGTAVNVSNSDDIIGAVLSATSKLSHEAMRDVKVTIKGRRTADIVNLTVYRGYRLQRMVLRGNPVAYILWLGQVVLR
jgi:Ca-activated chloride channel family protein